MNEPRPSGAPTDDVIGSAAPRRRLPRGVVAGVTAVLALAVVGGGVWAAGKIGEADRTAPPTRAWAEASPKQQAEEPLLLGGVGAKLLPVPDGYLPGPDIGSLGNDNVLDAGRTAEHARDVARGLHGYQREEIAAALEELTFTGGARRSYYRADDRLVVELHLAQVKKAGADSALSRFREDVDSALGGVRKGPPVKANADADCYLMPDTEGRELDAMLCSAYTHDVVVTAYAYGSEKLDTKEIARVFAAQLHQVVSPGESV
ncbi:hypothetical protein ACFUN8_03480 [Streptomyces sp. NPDC057307]|uniref:hypothetical protein n=1 Tax=Streptomyces sp. NPDC057307 TaxID=3346096 RepID=UPI00362E0326